MSTSLTYLFAGASSAIAIEAAILLKAKGHRVIGLSTKKSNPVYDEFYTVEKYKVGFLPNIQQPIGGLVYFPGTINLMPFYRLSEQDFLKDYEINSLGAVACTQTYLPNLKNSVLPGIVFISTVAVSAGMPFHSSIAMAKGAIEGLVKSLAAEFAPSIRVNCVAPSLTDTPLSERFINGADKLETSQKRNPLKKAGSAEEVANAVVFLLSKESLWLTGQVIAVDGGMSTLRLV